MMIHTDLIGASLTWKRAGKGWRLFDGSRRFGDVVPDDKHAGMWRCVLSGGRLSDMANLSWARNAVMEAAVRELEYEARHKARIAQETEGVFAGAARYSDLNPIGGERYPPPTSGLTSAGSSAA